MCDASIIIISTGHVSVNRGDASTSASTKKQVTIIFIEEAQPRSLRIIHLDLRNGSDNISLLSGVEVK